MRRGTQWLCVGIFLAVAAWTAGHSYQAITTNASVEFLGDSLPVIIIDPGHGGFDGGATSEDGLIEKDINLAISQKLYDLFKMNGFQVILTRDTDKDLSDEGLTTIRQRKNSDIHNRLALANSYSDTILLSIHQNKFMRSKYWGAQVFYGPQNPESQKFGEIMQRTLIEMVQPENTRQYKPCEESVYLIHNAPMPALLVECGFLSNPEEAQKLNQDSYQKKLSFAIFSATAEYLGLEAEQSQ